MKKWLAVRYDRSYHKEWSRQEKLLQYEENIDALEKQEKERTEAADCLPSCRIIRFRDVLQLWNNPSSEEILLFVSEKGKPADGMCRIVSGEFALKPELMLLYGDEDIMEHSGRRIQPWLKPDWSPALYEEYFYLGSVVAVRRSVLEGIDVTEAVPELCTKILHKLGGFGKDTERKRIGHVNSILFHGRDAGLQEEYLAGVYPCKKDGVWTESLRLSPSESLVSVIIPSKDNPDMLRQNLGSLKKTTNLQKLEIIIVDNGSNAENKTIIEKLKQDIINCGGNIRYLYQPMPFHFSRMCNLGADQANGSLLLFLNDDVEALETGWLEAMASMAHKPYAGAVGAKLLYPGTDKIQHAGITNLPMGPVHKLQFHEDSTGCYCRVNRITNNVLAVTGACLMVRRELFWEAGGFCEELPVAFNDVDLCFGLYEMGYYNIQMNGIRLSHHESVSRGNDEAEDKLLRLVGERERLYNRHPFLRGKDPFYHIWLNRKGLDTRIVPVCGSEDGRAEESTPHPMRKCPPRLRKHPGVLIRVEYSEGSLIQGYIVVVGDNNACYERKLILWDTGFRTETDAWDTPACMEESIAAIPEGMWELPIKSQIRQDIWENMPDQVNVGLAGFAVNAVGLPAGKYRIGASARNKITGVTLLNWSNRYLVTGVSEQRDNGQKVK